MGDKLEEGVPRSETVYGPRSRFADYWLLITDYWLLITLLYLAGIGHWVWFFNGGDLTLEAYDWPKEAMYFQVLQEALREGRVPFHIEMSAEYVQEFPHLGRGRFLGLC